MKKVIHKIKSKPLFVSVFWSIINMALALPLISRADTYIDDTGGGGEIKNPIISKTFAQLVENIANIVFKIGFPIAVIFIIYSGFLFVTARGNEESLKKAKGTFMWAAIGTAVLLGAKIIATAIKNTVGSL